MHLKEVMKPVWPVVHFLWVGRVCVESVQVLIHLLIGSHEPNPITIISCMPEEAQDIFLLLYQQICSKSGGQCANNLVLGSLIHQQHEQCMQSCGQPGNSCQQLAHSFDVAEHMQVPFIPEQSDVQQTKIIASCLWKFTIALACYCLLT